METPNEVFWNNGSTYYYSSNTTSYSQASNPTFTFDFSFSVDLAATLSQNSMYAMFLESGTSSIELMQGANVVDTGVLTGAPGPYYYSLPSATLLPDTQYDLVVTTLGVPVSLNPGYSGGEGWGQIPVDISAAAPEPNALPLLAIAVLGIPAFSLRRGVSSNRLIALGRAASAADREDWMLFGVCCRHRKKEFLRSMHAVVLRIHDVENGGIPLCGWAGPTSLSN